KCSALVPGISNLLFVTCPTTRQYILYPVNPPQDWVFIEDSQGLRDCSYLPVGTLRRSSSKKFWRKVTWFCVFCPSAVSTGINETMRLPSGARLTFLMELTKRPSSFSDHTRGLSATKESRSGCGNSSLFLRFLPTFCRGLSS